MQASSLKSSINIRFSIYDVQLWLKKYCSVAGNPTFGGTRPKIGFNESSTVNFNLKFVAYLPLQTDYLEK